MRKFILTSDRFTGRMVFGFHLEFDVLVFYSNETEILRDQHTWLLKYLPHTPADLKHLVEKVKGVIAEEPADISFDAFWIAYSKKINKIRALPLYNKLSSEDKLMAIVKIKAYRRYCNENKRGIVDPERYLKDRYFETDWRGI